jgi:hypothetical protein
VGELLRFPGAEVDWDHLDTFEWTTALLIEYAERATELAYRYGGFGFRRLSKWPAGPRCQDCDRSTRRVRLRCGSRLLCAECGRSRVRVAVALGKAA